MVPNIFVSSTINDLPHFREVLRDTILEIGYNPVMSEFGEIGYMPNDSAEKSCYTAVGDCQMLVLVIGKCYGTIGSNGRSITHNEFQQAIEKRIPVLCFVDQEVMVYKSVYDNQPNAGIKFPNMDAPELTFRFLDQIKDLPSNNGIVTFNSASDASKKLKQQIAHFVGELLRNRFDPMRQDIRDVLAQVQTLRQEFLHDEKKPNKVFLKIAQMLLDDDDKSFRETVSKIAGDVGNAILQIIDCESFDNFVDSQRWKIELREPFPDLISNRNEMHDLMIDTFNFSERIDLEGPIKWAFTKDKKLLINTYCKKYFDGCYNKIKTAIQDEHS